MATELLATGNTATSGADFTIAITEVALIFLKGLTGSPFDDNKDLITIDVKDSAGAYTPYKCLNTTTRFQTLDTIGTYRITRKNYGPVVGVERA